MGFAAFEIESCVGGCKFVPVVILKTRLLENHVEWKWAIEIVGGACEPDQWEPREWRWGWAA